MKTFIVTQSQQVNKRQIRSKVVGFVSVFGWESAEDKAAKKYAGLDNIQVHEAPRTRKR